MANNGIHWKAPDIKAIFTSITGDKIVTRSLKFGGDIVSISTQKSKMTPAGTFNITMIARDNFLHFFSLNGIAKNPFESSAWQVFKAGALVDIYINDKEVMLGMIDAVKKSVSVGKDGKPIRAFTIVGRDLGAFLVDHKVFYDVKAKDIQYVQGVEAGLHTFGVIGGKSPGKLIEKIINTWLVGVVNQSLTINGQVIEPFQYADGSSIQDKFIAVLNTQVGPLQIFVGTDENKKFVGTVNGPGGLSSQTYANQFPIKFSMSSHSSDLWGYINQIVSNPFDEVFVTTGSNSLMKLSSSSQVFLQEGKVYLIFRPVPYDDSFVGIESSIPSLHTMQDLNGYFIDDSMIQTYDIEQGRNNIPSAYFVFPTYGTTTYAAGKYYAKTEYDVKALRRFGYNPVEVQLKSYYVDEKQKEGDGVVIKQCEDFQKKIRSWFENSDKYLSGSFTIMGSPEIKIGNRLEYVKDDAGNIEDEYLEGYYYIVGVNHNWQYGENYSTTVAVERGVSKKEFKVNPTITAFTQLLR